MWIKNDAIIAKDKPLDTGGVGSIKVNPEILSGGLGGDSTKSVPSTKSAFSSKESENPSVKSDASSSKSEGGAGAAKIPTSSVPGGASDIGGGEGDKDAPSVAAASPVSDSDSERIAKLQSQKAIAKEEADIESLLLKKANAKKGREQLEKAGKPDATDVAQNLGSSGINLGIGVSTLLLAALIPPLGIPLTLAAAGFLAKGSFQGLSGVLGAAEVAGGAIEGAAKSVGKTAQSLGKAAGAAKDNVVATGKAVGKGAYTVGKGAASAAGAAGRAAGATKDAARNLYNRATGRNAPDIDDLNRKVQASDTAQEFVDSSYGLSNSDQFKDLTDILTARNVPRAVKQERESVAKGLSDALEKDPANGLEKFANKIREEKVQSGNNKRINDYYNELANAAEKLGGRDESGNYKNTEYSRYVQAKTNFDNDDREPAKAAKKALGDYQEDAQEYGKNIKVKYIEPDLEDNVSVLTRESKVGRDAGTSSDTDSIASDSVTQRSGRTSKQDEVIKDPVKFAEKFRENPQNFQAFIEQDPYNAANNAKGVKEAAEKGDSFAIAELNEGLEFERQRAAGIKKDVNESVIRGATRGDSERGETIEEAKQQQVDALKSSKGEKAAPSFPPLGLSTPGSDTGSKTGDQPQYVFSQGFAQVAREGEGRPGHYAAAVQSDAEPFKIDPHAHEGETVGKTISGKGRSAIIVNL